MNINKLQEACLGVAKSGTSYENKITLDQTLPMQLAERLFQNKSAACEFAGAVGKSSTTNITLNKSYCHAYKDCRLARQAKLLKIAMTYFF